MERKPFVDNTFTLKKFPGKGGWTYIPLPKVPVVPDHSVAKTPVPKLPFSWIIVDGDIDNYPLCRQKLMPMGNGRHFLAVNATIRKKIKKQEGDTVQVKLFFHQLPEGIPEELKACFQTEPPQTWENFMTFTEKERTFRINWIYSAKTEEQKAERILKLLEDCSSGTPK